MPRIQILKPSTSGVKSDRETVHVDICNCCLNDLGLKSIIDGHKVPIEIAEIDRENIPVDSIISVVNAEHPPYEAEETPCYMCDDTLAEEDNLLCSLEDCFDEDFDEDEDDEDELDDFDEDGDDGFDEDFDEDEDD